MKLIKDFEKLLSNKFILSVGGLILVLALVHYSSNKSITSDYMEVQHKNGQPHPIANNNILENEHSLSGGAMPASVSSNSNHVANNPGDLLPKDENSEWANLNPGVGNLTNVNLLKAGYHTGIDTVGQSLRNANLQLRSEPANPQLNVGPWNQTTINPDTHRKPLDCN